jgi:CheY-like chemotaxis protein
MPEGGTILIRTAERRMTADDLRVDEAAPGDYVEIALLDQGVGMTPEVQARAFEPFFTTKPVGVGTGLGLSQLYGFVQQSGGFVRLESAPGRGTAISLYLPRHAGPVEDSPAAAKPVPPGGRFEAIARFAGVPARLLVVEDDDAGRALIGESLRDRRYDVLEAADGLDGLRLLQSDEAFDLMVTDIGLPGVNGRQLAEAARLARPGLPVLLITGDAGAALKDWAVPPGMRILRKPFSLELLVDTIGAMLAPQTVPAGPEASGPERSGLGVR